MNGITFGTLHSYDDLHLILLSKTISSPTIKTNIIDIPGSDGQIDLTDYFGEVYYTNRLITFEFATKVNPKIFLNLFSEVQNRLHGKMMKIILDEDLDYYYYGRINVNEWKSNKRIGLITIEVDADPYKYKTYETKISEKITNKEDIILLNGRKRVIPKIIVDSDMTINFNGESYVLNVGTYEPSDIPDFILNHGSNILEVIGNGNITITYQEGDL